MNKQPEITAQTRQNLIDAFWSLYCENKIEKISVKEITLKAGYNRGTFYEYFIDVYDVLEQIENSLIPTTSEFPPVTAPTGTIDMPLHMFIKLYEQNSKYYTVLLGEKGDPSFAGKLKLAVKPVIKNILMKMPCPNHIEIDYILEYMLSSMIGIMSYWFQQNKSLPAERVIALMYELMDNGVMKKLIE
jgi:AcrR family transcriptional regulator